MEDNKRRRQMLGKQVFYICLIIPKISKTSGAELGQTQYSLVHNLLPSTVELLLVYQFGWKKTFTK